MSRVKQGLQIVKATFKDFSDDEATWKAAALAYYTVFALPPLLVLLLQVASAIWDPIEVRRTLTGEFQSLMGQDVAGQIQTMINQAEQKVSGTGFRLVLSIAGLVFGATGAFISLQSALNRAWEVKPDPKQGGIKVFITKRLLSLGMVLGVAFLLLVSLALTSALSAASGVILGGLPKAVGTILNFVISFAVVTVLFAAIFKVLPDAKIAWRDVWVGAVMTALLFVIGKFLIGLYIGKSNPGNAFGAAGSLAVLLVWIYYTAVIVLLGAEFTQAWVKQHGGTIEPEEGAVRVVEREERLDEKRKPERAHAAGMHDDRSREVSHTGGDRARRTPLWLRLPVASRAHGAVRSAREWMEDAIAHLRADVLVARREIGALLRSVGVGSIHFATAAVLALLGAFSVIAGLILLIGDQWLPRDRYWLSALAVAVISGVVAVVLVRRGLDAVKLKSLTPQETVETPREDAAWLRGEAAPATADGRSTVAATAKPSQPLQPRTDVRA